MMSVYAFSPQTDPFQAILECSFSKFSSRRRQPWCRLLSLYIKFFRLMHLHYSCFNVKTIIVECVFNLGIFILATSLNEGDASESRGTTNLVRFYVLKLIIFNLKLTRFSHSRKHIFKIFSYFQRQPS